MHCVRSGPLKMSYSTIELCEYLNAKIDAVQIELTSVSRLCPLYNQMHDAEPDKSITIWKGKQVENFNYVINES